MRIQKCKGTRDLSPSEMAQFRLVETVFRETCLQWDYQEVRTPTLEYLHLFTSTGTLTPSTLGRVYSFLDWDGWSGERVVLRPDGTIPVVRMYIDNPPENQLARLFYINNIFIFEPTGKETREKWQCGAELIGVASATADVELLVIALETLQKIGVNKTRVILSHAGLIRALLTGFRLSPEAQSQAFDRILDGDLAVITQLKEQSPELIEVLTPLLDLTGITPGFIKNIKTLFGTKIPELTTALDNFINITELLTAIGQQYEIDIASGRGFEYYTGVIFQLLVEDVKVGGGGRYDALIPLLGGKNVPASGFALYIDPIIELIKQYSSAEITVINIQIKGQSLGTQKKAFEIVKRLHDIGFKTDIVIETKIPNTGWLIVISDNQPYYSLNNINHQKICFANTIEAVLKAIGEGK